jgi:S-adenosylmethionine hydrolase
MAIITLTSDYGTKDYFTAAIKGAILSEAPEAQIVDISHKIAPFNIEEAAYILKNAYHHFPQGTIHMIGIDAEATSSKAHIICKVDGHYFIGADTGIFSLMFPLFKPEQIIALNIAQEDDSIPFPMKDVFVKAACHINRGGTLQVIGRQIDKLKDLIDFQPVLSADRKTLNGQVIYIDHYGNVISNITHKVFKESFASSEFEIKLPRKYSIKAVHKSYSQVTEGEMLALFNSAGHLEIDINKGDSNAANGASGLLGIKIKDRISIEFL